MTTCTSAAQQRTFEGAYWRTGISAFSMGLLILKAFSIEFYHISLVFLFFGSCILAIAYVRSQNTGHIYDITVPFKTNGDMVVVSFILSLCTFSVLFVLLYQLIEEIDE